MTPATPAASGPATLQRETDVATAWRSRRANRAGDAGFRLQPPARGRYDVPARASSQRRRRSTVATDRPGSAESSHDTPRSPVARCSAGRLVVLAGVGPADPCRVLTRQVRGNGTDLGETPVVVALKAPIPAGAYLLEPGRRRAGASPPQVFHDDGKSYLAFVLDHGPRGASRPTRSDPTPRPTGRGPGVAFRRDGANVEVLVDGKPFTVYLTDEATKPYYYPVIGPTGAPITRAYPDEERSRARTRTTPTSGRSGSPTATSTAYDFWASDPLNKPKPNSARSRRPRGRSSSPAPSLGVLRTTDDWLGPDGKKVCEDERVGPVLRHRERPRPRLRHHAQGDRRPRHLRRHQGGDVRPPRRVEHGRDARRRAGKITNAEGITDDAAWGKASPWVDYTGPVEGKTVGVAILNHPDSFRYPTTWHVRDYGLFAANPFGWHDFGQKTSGEYTLPAGRVDPVPLPGHPPRGRHRLGRASPPPSRPTPGPAEVDDQRMIADSARRRRVRRRSATPSSGRSCGSTGRSSTHWPSRIRAQRGTSGRRVGRSRS